MTTTQSERLTILSEAEQFALYGLPDFDDAQRLDYLSLSEAELALASRRPIPTAQAYCVLQIGYFKAKHAFFRFTWDAVQDDGAFVLTRYFNDQVVELTPITKHEHYTQRTLIAELFAYRLWSAELLAPLAQQLPRRSVVMSPPDSSSPSSSPRSTRSTSCGPAIRRCRH